MPYRQYKFSRRWDYAMDEYFTSPVYMYVNIIVNACLYPNAALAIYVGKRASYLGHSVNVPHVYMESILGPFCCGLSRIIHENGLSQWEKTLHEITASANGQF